jgi:hypothetical protein
VARYEATLSDGFSDAEAPSEGWPEVEEYLPADHAVEPPSPAAAGDGAVQTPAADDPTAG